MVKIPNQIEPLIILITFPMEITNVNSKISEKEDIQMEKDLDLNQTL